VGNQQKLAVNPTGNDDETRDLAGEAPPALFPMAAWAVGIITNAALPIAVWIAVDRARGASFGAEQFEWRGP
jgi:hypothetical protein